jgi:hypothetical protein
VRIAEVDDVRCGKQQSLMVLRDSSVILIILSQSWCDRQCRAYPGMSETEAHSTAIQDSNNKPLILCELYLSIWWRHRLVQCQRLQHGHDGLQDA